VFSVRGMVTLFPGAPTTIIGMAIAMESAKLVVTAWLAARWLTTAWIWRLVLMALVGGLATINATGVYAQLVSAHVDIHVTSLSTVKAQDATLAAKIAAQNHVLEDIDHRIQQIDHAVEVAATKGRTKTALSAMDSEQKARTALVDERKREGATLVALQSERAGVAAKGREAESESMPIRYVAELLGVDTDAELAIRWLIALMVMCCDPLAIAITAAASMHR
jgi:hypothetical protein